MTPALQIALGNVATQLLIAGVSYHDALDTLGHELTARALARTRGNLTGTARILGTTRRVLRLAYTRRQRPGPTLSRSTFAATAPPVLCTACARSLVPPARAQTLAPWEFGLEGSDLRRVRYDLEMRCIFRALELAGSATGAARLLHVKPRAFRKRLQGLRRRMLNVVDQDDAAPALLGGVHVDAEA